MPFKDHYKTLEIAPNAGLHDIKKAYRQLAHRYHPDKNKDNQFATAHFREIQEAYHTLSNTQRRARYDEERWLSGYSMKKQPESITPEWLLRQSQKLSAHMATVDTFRMSHVALHDYVMLMLSDDHMAILQQAGNGDINSAIVQELLKAIKSLDYPYLQVIAQRLVLLAGSDEVLINNIASLVQQRKEQYTWEKYKPYIMLGTALFFCFLMYLYVHFTRHR